MLMAIYHPADIAKLLQVKEPTVRKYSLLLEEVGYTFKRNASGQRWYEDKDVIALQKLVTFKHNGNMNLKDAAEAVFHWSKGETVTDSLTVISNATNRNTSDITRDVTSDIEAVENLLKQQEQRYIQALVEMQKKQQERDKILLDTISELKEQIERQQEQLTGPISSDSKKETLKSHSQQPIPKKKGFFSRLFK